MTDDPPRWEAALAAALSAVAHAQAVVASGEATDDLHERVAVTAARVDQAERDRKLVMELDELDLGA